MRRVAWARASRFLRAVRLSVFARPAWAKQLGLAGVLKWHGSHHHADFARAGHVHVPYASLGERYAKSAVVCTAPSKTFNLAGLQLSNIFIPNPDLRAAFRRTLDRTGYDEPSVFGVTATQACYEQGEEWLDELKGVLDENYAVLEAAARLSRPGAR